MRRPLRAPLPALLPASSGWWAVMLAALAALSLSCGTETTPEPPVALDHAFPKGFLWGTATAGFQVDMGCPTLSAAACDDTHSDWYQFVTDPDLVADASNYLKGEPVSIGPGMWETYDADFARAKTELHNNAVRLSLEWSRLFPDGAAEKATTVEELDAYANTKARDHYRAMFASARKHGLTLLVTLNHYTLPLWVHDGKACNIQGVDTCKNRGWIDKDRIIRTIALYSGWCAKNFGDQVDLWATLNEPFAIVLSGYILPSKDRTNPPAVYFNVDHGIQVAFTMMEAHARMYDAVHTYDTVVADGGNSPAMVGLVPNLTVVQPNDPTDPAAVTAAAHLHHVYNQVFLEATINGRLDRNLDGIYEEVRDDMKGRMDYIGVNYYTRIIAQPKPFPGAAEKYPFLDATPDLAAGVWQDYPAGIREMVSWAAKTYKLPVIITENGTFKDKATAFEGFLKPHLTELHKAMAEPGVTVLGYFMWSLLDNYEWNHGMALRFGLYAVDTTKQSKPRTLTELGRKYGEVAEKNGF